MSEIYHSFAEFSACRQYRYTLWRSWNRLIASGDNYVNFIMLNPSTADEHANDRTVSKCIKFAKSWGFDGLCVTNLFAYRSTDRSLIKKVGSPIGSDNDLHIQRAAGSAKMVVAAWGEDGPYMGRSWAVQLMLRGTAFHYLRIGKSGEPYHPLYLPDSTKPTFWYQ